MKKHFLHISTWPDIHNNTEHCNTEFQLKSCRLLPTVGIQGYEEINYDVQCTIPILQLVYQHFSPFPSKFCWDQMVRPKSLFVPKTEPKAFPPRSELIFFPGFWNVQPFLALVKFLPMSAVLLALEH